MPVLAFILLYKIGGQMAAIMTMPLYLDLGLSRLNSEPLPIHSVSGPRLQEVLPAVPTARVIGRHA